MNRCSYDEQVCEAIAVVHQGLVYLTLLGLKVASWAGNTPIGSYGSTVGRLSTRAGSGWLSVEPCSHGRFLFVTLISAATAERPK